MIRALTNGELQWLKSRGNRTEEDVLWNEIGEPYVMMRDGSNREDIPVYIPKYQN